MTFYQLKCLALTKSTSPPLRQKRSFTHSGQVLYTSLQIVSSFSLVELAKDNAAGDWTCAIIVRGFHGDYRWELAVFIFQMFHFNYIFFVLFDHPFSATDPLLLHPPNHWWQIRWLMIWKSCLSSWSVLPNYFLVAPAYLYKSLYLCLDEKFYSRDYFACMHMMPCAFLTAASASDFGFMSQTPACSLLTQINSVIQLPLSCIITLGHTTCPNQKVTGKVWWVVCCV